MADQVLFRLLRNKSQWPFFLGYAKERGYKASLEFIGARPLRRKIYETYFSPTPKVRIEGLEEFACQAQGAYRHRLDKARAQGCSASEAHAIAIDAAIFETLLAAGQKATEEMIEKTLYTDYRASIYYERYVETRVCGNSIAGTLDYPATAAEELARAKIMLLFGRSGAARTSAEEAIRIKTRRASRGGSTHPSVTTSETAGADHLAELMQSLDRIPVDVGP